MRTCRRCFLLPSLILSFAMAAPAMLSVSTAARAEWAIAFAQGSGAAWSEGASWDAATRQIAISSAMSSCSKKLGGCFIVHQGSNGCVALAIQDGGNGWGAARRDSLGGALSAAMDGCVKNSPLGCSIKVQFCDRSSGFQEAKTTEAEKQAYEAALERARLNRVRKQAEGNGDDDDDDSTTFLNEFARGLRGNGGALSPGERAPQFACLRPGDYEACIRQGATGRGGGGPTFCHHQFCQ